MNVEHLLVCASCAREFQKRQCKEVEYLQAYECPLAVLDELEAIEWE